MGTGIVRWEKPPAERALARASGYPNSGPFDSYAIAAALKAEPGRWALAGVVRGGSHYASMMRWGKGSKAWLPAGSFETTTRAVPDGLTAVFARYVGGES